MTKLEKLPDAEKLKLCRQYFMLGFACLPFMWAINFLWFFNQAFIRKPEFPEQARIHRFVVLSGIGALLWSVVLIAWIFVYQTSRVEWGALGDNLSLVFPRGYA